MAHTATVENSKLLQIVKQSCVSSQEHAGLCLLQAFGDLLNKFIILKL